MKNLACFLDFEFMTEKIEDSGQEMLSIGAVFLDHNENKIKDTYYSLCRPRINTDVSKFCTELTGLTQEMIDSAPLFDNCVNDFEKKIKSFEEEDYDISYYVWGNFDKINLRKILSIYNYNGLFKSIVSNLIDIQPKISRSIKFNDTILRRQWGLSNMRNIYQLNKHNHTEHNALSDAIALCDIYIAYKSDYPVNHQFLQEVALDDQRKKLDRINSLKEKCLELYNEIDNSSLKHITCELYGSLLSLYNHNTLEKLNNYNLNLEYYPWGIILDTSNIKNKALINGKPYFTFSNLKIDICKSIPQNGVLDKDNLIIFLTINIINQKPLNIKYKLHLNANTYKYAYKFFKLVNAS